jgi:subtilisin family serine protease
LRKGIVLIGTAAAVLCLSGAGLGAPPGGPTIEVVVTLKAAPLSAFRDAAAPTSYRRQLSAAHVAAERNVLSALPSAHVRWHYSTVANGFAVVVPRSEVARLAHVPGVDRVWPNVRYHTLLDRSPFVIGADKLWGLPSFATAGNGMKIGIIDDGVDASHPFFDPSGFTYPAGFPKGQTAAATPKVIVQRTFVPPSPSWKNASRPFDPDNSFHATHVAGIAAGNHGVNAAGRTLTGIAPNAQIGNYKALTIPTPGFGLDGNAAEIAAAIEAAVQDGMNVINLSLGEPEIEPSRDIVVKAIEGAAAAGVVPVVAAGNDFDEFGFGSVSSPANAPSAITVAAASKTGVIASFSSAGPTPVSLRAKPDVTAPGVSILSSVPASEGLWTQLQGTSMAAPHVSGAAALLKERHPTWTVAQIKSALVLTGRPVLDEKGAEVSALREGGGMIDLPRADNPFVFASPSSVAFPVNGGAASVALADAGGGAGTWNVAVAAGSDAGVTVPPTVTVPGTLALSSRPNATSSGFVVLTRGVDVRRIPFFVELSKPALGGARHVPLPRPGVYSGTTRGGSNVVTEYRYPTGGDDSYPGPERVYRVHVGAVANFGVAVLSGTAVPHITFPDDEHHLVGYTGLPLDLNPYRGSYGDSRRIAGAILPAAGTYDIVFDSRSASAAGPFRFRYWTNDVTPPQLRVVSARNRRIVVSATDAGAGVDPASISAAVDGRAARATFASGRITITAAPGRHRLQLTVADYQETKNMEDVPRIRPNTRTLTATVTVR